MREIVFRGKSADNGEWVEGVPTWDESDSIWDESDAIPKLLMVSNVEKWPFGNAYVDPETVGQFTGLTDKNGKKIFEGDIVRIEDFANAVVKWREDIACWTLQGYIIGNTWDSSMLEVIGNIHDNPELLEGGTC
jgi:uncharacterized phage protein (TIGR01671 family)